MSAALRDVLQRNVALGLRFHDVAAATSLGEARNPGFPSSRV